MNFSDLSRFHYNVNSVQYRCYAFVLSNIYYLEVSHHLISGCTEHIWTMLSTSAEVSALFPINWSINQCPQTWSITTQNINLRLKEHFLFWCHLNLLMFTKSLFRPMHNCMTVTSVSLLELGISFAFAWRKEL